MEYGEIGNFEYQKLGLLAVFQVEADILVCEDYLNNTAPRESSTGNTQGSFSLYLYAFCYLHLPEQILFDLKVAVHPLQPSTPRVGSLFTTVL